MFARRIRCGSVICFRFICFMVINNLVISNINGTSSNFVSHSGKIENHDSADNSEIRKYRNYGSIITKNGCVQNSSEVIHNFKLLVHQNNVPNFIESESACLRFLRAKLQDSERFHVMRKRTHIADAGCLKSDNDLHFPLHTTPFMKFTDSNHRINYCNNGKAGSTTLVRYAMKLNNHEEAVALPLLKTLKTNLQQANLHMSIRKYFPKLNVLQNAASLAQNLNLIVVRHPFQRAVSCYNDKILDTDYFAKHRNHLYRTMQQFSKFSSSDVESMFSAIQGLNMNEYSIAFKLRTIPCSKMEPMMVSDSPKNGKPTFRGFILGMIFERISLCNTKSNTENKLCLTERDFHTMRFLTNCAPCDVHYDGIIKVESYEEDMKFFEELLELPPVWDCLHGKIPTSIAQNEHVKNRGKFSCVSEQQKAKRKLDFNRGNKHFSLKEYLSSLSDFEKNLFYSAYYEDFLMFDYNPCVGL